MIHLCIQIILCDYTHHIVSDTNVLDREPTEAVPTMEESVGDCESCGDLAIATPQVTPNQGKWYPAY